MLHHVTLNGLAMETKLWTKIKIFFCCIKGLMCALDGHILFTKLVIATTSPAAEMLLQIAPGRNSNVCNHDL